MSDQPQLITQGTESFIYLTQDEPATILKKKRPNGQTRYMFEAYAYRQLHKLGAHVPIVITASDDSIQMSLLQGSELDDKTHLFKNVNLFKEIASDLSLCRKVTFSGFGSAIQKDDNFVGEFPDWQSFLEHEYEYLYTSLRNSDILTPEETKALFSFWRERQPTLDPGVGMLVHGDFAISAIFVHDDRYEGIIDFGDAFIGDPLMDLAYFRFKEITKDYGESLYHMLLDNYTAISKLDLQRTESDVLFYMVYWAAKRLHQSHDVSLKAKFAEKAKAVLRHLTQ